VGLDRNKREGGYETFQASEPTFYRDDKSYQPLLTFGPTRLILNLSPSQLSLSLGIILNLSIHLTLRWGTNTEHRIEYNHPEITRKENLPFLIDQKRLVHNSSYVLREAAHARTSSSLKPGRLLYEREKQLEDSKLWNSLSLNRKGEQRGNEARECDSFIQARRLVDSSQGSRQARKRVLRKASSIKGRRTQAIEYGRQERLRLIFRDSINKWEFRMRVVQILYSRKKIRLI